MFEGMSRRSFVKALAVSAVSSSAIKSSLGQDRVAASGQPTEWSYTSGKQYSDPFNQVDAGCHHHPALWSARAHAGILGWRL